ncbi:MAG: phospholipase D-like domain-containing protein [Promethearchaeota archaeon]
MNKTRKKLKKHHLRRRILIYELFFILSAIFLWNLPLLHKDIVLLSMDSKLIQAGNIQEGTDAAQKVVDYFREVFSSDWKRGEEYDKNVDVPSLHAQSSTRYGSGYEPYETELIQEFMKVTPILSPDNSETEIINLINSAQEKLFIEQMYIYPTLTDIIDAIIAANNRGVEVKVILDDGNSNSGITADLLENGGINDIRVSKENASKGNYFNTMHNKGVIVDNKTLISSINWSPTSLRENREAGLIIESELISDYYEMIFDYDWIASEVYDSESHFLSSSDITEPIPAKTPISSDYSYEFNSTETFEGDMVITAMSSPDNCFDVIVDLLDNAEKSIDISVYTLSSPYILEILLDRIANGVEVRLLLEKYQVGSYERAYNRWAMLNLTEYGIPSIADPGINYTAKGLWADSYFDFQHCKYSIIDNKTLILSSGNWGRSSCPKPQDDGDVDGNRDWWVVIYGSGSARDLTVTSVGDLPTARGECLEITVNITNNFNGTLESVNPEFGTLPGLQINEQLKLSNGSSLANMSSGQTLLWIGNVTFTAYGTYDIPIVTDYIKNATVLQQTDKITVEISIPDTEPTIFPIIPGYNFLLLFSFIGILMVIIKTKKK